MLQLSKHHTIDGFAVQELLNDFLDRAEDVNDSDLFAYTVEHVAIFGSILDQPRVHIDELQLTGDDLQLAVSLRPKYETGRSTHRRPGDDVLSHLKAGGPLQLRVADEIFRRLDSSSCLRTVWD